MRNGRQSGFAADFAEGDCRSCLGAGMPGWLLLFAFAGDDRQNQVLRACQTGNDRAFLQEIPAFHFPSSLAHFKTELQDCLAVLMSQIRRMAKPSMPRTADGSHQSPQTMTPFLNPNTAPLYSSFARSWPQGASIFPMLKGSPDPAHAQHPDWYAPVKPESPGICQ